MEAVHISDAETKNGSKSGWPRSPDAGGRYHDTLEQSGIDEVQFPIVSLVPRGGKDASAEKSIRWSF